MQISVTFRHIEPSEALKNYVTDRLNKFKRYLEGPVEAHVVLGLEKFRNLADVTINSNGRVIKGREENVDMYAAIDLVMDKIDMQLKRFREKQRDKGDRTRPAAAAPMVEPQGPQIRRKSVEVPALRVDDAVEMLQKGGQEILIFSDVATGCLKVLHRRQDGALQLVEPDFKK
jgi:putative sigma-54 modulation protein